jgi:DNA-binding transcriptional LysR family regulator
LIRDMLAQASAQPFQLYGSASVALIARMACDGIGTAVISPVCLRDELARGELRVLDVDAAALPDLAFGAAWLQGPGSHVARTIARLAQYVASEI